MKEKYSQTKSCTCKTAQAHTQQFLPCCHCVPWFNCNQKTINEPQESFTRDRELSIFRAKSVYIIWTTDIETVHLLQCVSNCCRESIWDFSFNGSMVPWVDVQSICDCSAVQSAVCLSKCLGAAPIFLLRATRHFIWLSGKICAEIVVYWMFAVFSNGLNGKNSSRSIVRNIFSVYFFYSRFQD